MYLETRPQKRPKPSADFPLFSHSSGKWGKKNRRKDYYFGKWEDPEERQEVLKFANSKPKLSTGITVKQACHLFLESKKQMEELGELKSRTWADYLRTANA